jgi:hypothetical protein
MAATGSLPRAFTAPNIPYGPHLMATSSSFAPAATTNLPYNNFVKCTAHYTTGIHDMPSHAYLVVMSRMSATRIVFDCPPLATARRQFRQYHIVLGAHVDEMKAAFTNPLIAAPLASAFVHNHVTAQPHTEIEHITFLISHDVHHELLAVPGLPGMPGCYGDVLFYV